MSDDEGYGEDGPSEAQGDASEEFRFEAPDEDIQQLERVLHSTKDGLIFAIDCRKNMFREFPDSKKTPFSLAMAIVSTLMRRKVITGAKTQMMVLLWGTKHTKIDRFQNLYELMGLDIPTAGKISQLDTFAEWNKTGQKLFAETIGSLENSEAGGSVLSDLFWATALAFTGANFSNVDNKRIFVFTNDDNPCRHTPDLRQKTIANARDLEKANTNVTLWAMVKKEDRTFDANVFWKDVFSRPARSSEGEEEIDDDDEGDHDNVYHITSEGDLADIIESSRKKEFAKRTLVSIPMILGPNVEVGVKVYAIVLETKLPNAVALEEANARPLKITTRWFCKHTSHFLTPDQIVTYAKYGGVGRVPFSAQDRNRIKRFAPASLSILGFKPLRELPDWQNVRAPYLLRPDEKSVKGSSKAFVALVSAAVTQEVFAVARMINNKSAAPKLVALVPQVEKLSGEDVEVPMGFLVVVLPYADDIRTPSFPEPFAEATEEQVDKAKRLVLKLSNAKPFDPREYENPALQKFWVNLEALALDKRDELTWKESENDTLRLPNEEELIFDEDFVDAAETFLKSYGGPGEIEAKKKPAAKKRRAPDDEEGETKPRKAAKAPVDASSVDWSELRNQPGGLESLTVPDLKVYLRLHSLPMSGTKAVLIERIKEHMDSGS